MEIGYAVTAINESTMTFDVDFDNGQWARIPLVLPFPTTDAELDALVKPYAPSVEQVQAAQAPSAGLEFLQSAIGVSRVTALQQSKTAPDAPEQAPLTLEEKQRIMWGKIEQERDSRKLKGGFNVGSLWFHSGLSERTDYGHILTIALENNLPDEYVFKDGWKTMSGEKVPMTIGLARQIRNAGVVLDGALFDNGELHRAAMMQADDPMAYDYSTGWPARYVKPA